MTARRRSHGLLVAATAAGLLVSAAAPSLAGGTTSKTYKTRADTLAGGVIVTPGLANLTLTDNLSGTHSDVLSGDASRTEKLSVKGVACKPTSLAFYGEAANWANVASTAAPARMRLYCTYPDGTKHSFHWGMTTLTSDGGDSDPGRTNCLLLSRTTAAGVSPTQYTVTTPDPSASQQCPALHEILRRNGTKELVNSAEDVPFHLTFTVSGAVPVG